MKKAYKFLSIGFASLKRNDSRFNYRNTWSRRWKNCNGAFIV